MVTCLILALVVSWVGLGVIESQSRHRQGVIARLLDRCNVAEASVGMFEDAARIAESKIANLELKNARLRQQVADAKPIHSVDTTHLNQE